MPISVEHQPPHTAARLPLLFRLPVDAPFPDETGRKALLLPVVKIKLIVTENSFFKVLFSFLILFSKGNFRKIVDNIGRFHMKICVGLNFLHSFISNF